MGLDSVELVMAFEEAFGIAIEDAAAEKMVTPRHVIDYVEQHRGVGTKKLCLSRRAFHRIRERLLAIGIARPAIRLGTPLAQFFPENTRRSEWVRARGPLAIHQWPDLVRPAKLQNAIAIVPVIVASAVLVSYCISTSGRSIIASFSLALFSAICSAVLLARVTRSQCRHFPGITTVRDLAVRVTAGGAASLFWEHEEFTRAEIASTVKQIIVEQLGIKESDYDEDKEFIRDFGVG